MTTQKAQSKIKSSTVAITVLSILLAIAVVSTIVLAAFTATKTGTTTITFGNGLTLQIGGDVTSGGQTGDPSFTITKSGIANAGQIVSAVTATPNQAAFIAYKVNPTVSAGEGFTLEAQAATSTTLSWNIMKDSTDHIATLVITFADTMGVVDGKNVVYTKTSVAQNNPVNLFSHISINLEMIDTGPDYYTVDNLAGLEISGFATTVGATTVDQTGDASTALAACKLVDATITEIA